MARQKTAVPLTPLEVKAAAIRRVRQRQRPLRYATYNDPHSEGKVRIQLDGGPGGIAEPTSVAEWCDDRLARCCPGTPPTDVLTEIFERIRTGGESAVRDAVRLAGTLDDHGQFAVFMVLNSTPGGGGGIETVKARLMREWKAAGLPMMPGQRAPFGRDPLDRDTPRPGPVRYRTPLGHNAA